MYRNACHVLNTEGQKFTSEIFLRTWNDSKERADYWIPFKPYLYVESKKGEYKTMFGTNARLLEFDNIIDRKRWMENNSDKRFFEAFRPERQFLIDRYETYSEEQFQEFQELPLRMIYFDIETSVSDRKLDAINTPEEICIITAYDSFEEKYHVFVLDKKNEYEFEEMDNVVYHIFGTEYQLLEAFIEWFEEISPDVLCGYNSEKFDLPYIINRSYKMFTEDFIKRLSPVKNMFKKTKGGTLKNPIWKIDGINHLDYMQLYKYKFGDKIPRYRLEDVGQHELGWGKLDYEGGIKQLYQQDYEKYVYYNIQDVQLLVELEKKKQFFKLLRKICNIGLCEYEGIYNTSSYINGALIQEAHMKGQGFISNQNKDHDDAEFEGAYVFPPKKGIYRNGIVGVDLNSLYPNIQRNINISPDTKVGKILSEDENTVKALIKGQVKEYNKDEFYKSINGKLVVAANNVLYINPNQYEGIIPSFLRKFYEMRKNQKEIMNDLKKQAAETNDKEKAEKLKEQAAEMKVADSAYKCFLNSTYGQMGNKYSPFFDVENAEAVTLSGQRMIKSSAEFINKMYSKLAGEDIEVITGGDTDSFSSDTLIEIWEDDQ